MPKDAAKQKKGGTQNFYDRIAELHNIALKFNGYRLSLEKFLRSLDLDIDRTSTVLDAGCGTGIVTLGFYDAGYRPAKVIAFDLSAGALGVALEQFQKEKRVDADKVIPVQGNVLTLPFADNCFDLVFSCGVLEYVPLDDGLREMSRVLRPGGRLVFIPVKPSLVGTVLELLYKFKIHPIESVRATAKKYFKIIGRYKFPIAEPIAWSRAIFLLEKK